MKLPLPEIEPGTSLTQVSVTALADVFSDHVWNLHCSTQQQYWSLLCMAQNHTMKPRSNCTSRFVRNRRYLGTTALRVTISFHTEKRVYKLCFGNTKIVTETYEQKTVHNDRKLYKFASDAFSSFNCSPYTYTIWRVNEIDVPILCVNPVCLPVLINLLTESLVSSMCYESAHLH
jgi:hypothetical protein